MCLANIKWSAGADPDLRGICCYNIWGRLEEKEYKITNTKLGTKVNIYL
jgi:hypothetical protein